MFSLKTNGLRTARSALVGAVTVAATVATLGGPAAAKPVPIDYNKCPDFHLCLFKAQFFGGSGPVQQPEQTTACVTLRNSSNNNATTSIINATDHRYYVYDGETCNGSPMATIFARTANDNIGPANNDRISSFKRIG
jgi:hypothetical protein